MRGHLALVLFSLFVKARNAVGIKVCYQSWSFDIKTKRRASVIKITGDKSAKANQTDHYHELTWNTEKLLNTCCQNKNQLLMWNFTNGVNERIMELQWFFNETTLICLDSKTIGFHIETLYNGRVERNGTAGILLKNVSLNDTGKYTLYVKLADEKIRNVQHIFLTVYEQVPYQCKPIIELYPSNVMLCSTSCEKLELSPEWIINRTRDPMGIGHSLQGIGRYLMINAGINEQAFCCLHGLKCHEDDQFKVCIPNPISSMGFTYKEDVHTSSQFEISTVKGTNKEACETSNQPLSVLIILVIIMMVVLFVITVAYFVWRRLKSFDVKPTKSNTTKERTENLQQVDIVAETTGIIYRFMRDSNSNQNIQIWNNISMDADILKYIVDSQRLLMMELETVKEESRKLKQKLLSYKHWILLQSRLSDNSIEMTEVKCHHCSHNNTDMSETTSVYEDAVSEPLIYHDWSGSIHSYLNSGYSSSDEH